MRTKGLNLRSKDSLLILLMVQKSGEKTTVWMVLKTLVNTGVNYQPQLVSWISSINSIQVVNATFLMYIIMLLMLLIVKFRGHLEVIPGMRGNKACKVVGKPIGIDKTWGHSVNADSPKSLGLKFLGALPQ